jgi:hypothetical protein
MICTTFLRLVGCCARRALLATGFGLLSAYAAASHDTAAALRLLADGARLALAELIEEPVRRLPLECIVLRSEGEPMREYVLRQQAQAIEALLASATAPAAGERVSLLLATLQRRRYASGTVRWLGDTTGSEATDLRLTASLGELPAALHERMHPPGCGASSSFRLDI